MLLVSSEASAHCFRVWHYPKPQRCFTALAPLPRIHIRPNPPQLTTPNQERIEIPLPALTFESAPDGDDYMHGIAHLRDLMSVPSVGQ